MMRRCARVALLGHDEARIVGAGELAEDETKRRARCRARGGGTDRRLPPRGKLNTTILSTLPIHYLTLQLHQGAPVPFLYWLPTPR